MRSHSWLSRTPFPLFATTTTTTSLACVQVADTLCAKAIVVFTERGTTVNKAAQLRPSVPVMGVTPNIETARGLALTWGVYPAVIEPDSDDVNFRMMLFKCCAVAQAKLIADKPTDLLVVTAGLPFKVRARSVFFFFLLVAWWDGWWVVDGGEAS